MVMAGIETAPGSGMEEPLSARLQWLRQRREALQEKLARKNDELKSLCVEEAELTGTLPPEIPLEPGESPPVFRRRVGTAFAYPQNLVDKSKSNEAEEVKLELERQVQVGIAEAALGIFNDPAESKAVRRKHRLVYQQSQRRLHELDARLNFVRQGRGKSTATHRQQNQPAQHAPRNSQHPQAVKHRTKKPRPPLDGTGVESNAASTGSILREGGVSLGPLGPEYDYHTYPGHGYHDADRVLSPPASVYNRNNRATHPAAASPVSRRQSPGKLIEHDLNDNHNVYILPDQHHRNRTYSHGSGGSRNQNHHPDAERNYRHVPNTYTEQERQMRYCQLQQLHALQQYPDYRATDNRQPPPQDQPQSQAYYNEHDSQSGGHYAHTPDYQPPYAVQQQQQQQQQRSLQQRRERELANSRILRNAGPTTDLRQPPGYWMRYNDEIVWCPDDQQPPVGERFGSLDRRKHNTLQHANSAGSDAGQSRYHTVAGIKSGGSASILPHQHHHHHHHHHAPAHAPPATESTPSPNRLLLRTQSLGSVETWHASHPLESPEGNDVADSASRKGKEKEWYETSLDAGSSPGPATTTVPQGVVRQQPSLKKAPINDRATEAVRETRANRRREIPAEEEQQQQRHFQATQTRHHQPPKVLEIPAESAKSSPECGGVPLESPTNRTIVQAGKYQPYREVTKPFEMSDFYKYSTKYRKKAESAQGRHTVAGGNNKPPQDPRVEATPETSQEPRLPGGCVADDRAVPSPVQKRIYQPLQRMTCQPYGALRQEDCGGEWNARSESEPASSATLV